MARSSRSAPTRTLPACRSLAVRSLLFIEDRYLFDERNPERNPAIEWNRFGLAAAAQVAELRPRRGCRRRQHARYPDREIPPFAHGVTGGVGDKLRQMLTASAHAYVTVPTRSKRREEIVTTYMNSTPLASMPGYGEVIGLPDALWVWFGTDFAELRRS